MVVPSRGSTAMATRGVSDAPTSPPIKRIGASSRSPSPITTRPLNCTALKALRIAWTAAWSAATLSPRPISLAAASAAASVTRTTSSARFRSTAPPFHGKWLPQSRFREKRIGDTDDLPVAVRECVDGGPVGQKRPVLPFDPVSESDARASKTAHFRAGGGVKGERHRLLGVGPDGHRGRMVGEQQNGQISPVSGPVEDRRHHLLVDPLDGPDFVRGASVVPRLVGRLHMDQDEILAFQLPEGVLRLPAEVTIDGH